MQIMTFSARRYFEGARAAMREADAKRRMRELMRSREGVRAYLQERRRAS